MRYKIIGVALILLSFLLIGSSRADISTPTPSIEEILGCLPPSSLECSDQNSYDRLSWRLQELGTYSSEIGKDQLNACQQQITDYQHELAIFNTCAPKLNLNFDQTQINSAIGSYVCSGFLENKGTYNKTTRMCECSSGYILYQSECKNPLEICQTKHGLNTIAQNGNCVVISSMMTLRPSSSPTATPYLPEKILKYIPTIKPNPPALEPANQLQYVPYDQPNQPITAPTKNGIMSSLRFLGRAFMDLFRIIF
ncbi:MAG: hypothetical protein A3I39_02255 [Candidatus Yanofskybacteria bacterium RIFCSPLOWO2_02_FULL_47_9b]|uniref:EGF-like domain-containing protein n=1 Tax=Candidatus Yanofskybacteria bacterium RIFCSPLOWO2_02_FULL_47_9b TaxID=1802708 RepID=A0A1F8H6E1_9BACT|nr:MAG: hypothetical protein A3I39_02255 [Candidatus Yanofskybacteria bacterium RIFCSPLOWO2_02_FULL_47_9b]